MTVGMKRLLPLLVIVACGCTKAVDVRESETASMEAVESAAPVSEAAKLAANEGGATASAFPSSTPPTDKASVTPEKYWVKLEQLDEKHEGHGE